MEEVISMRELFMQKDSKTYELEPTTGQKSFWKKARVVEYPDNTKVLYSYGTPVMMVYRGKELVRLWNGYSATTQKHINSFCGCNKKQVAQLGEIPEYVKKEFPFTVRKAGESRFINI